MNIPQIFRFKNNLFSVALAFVCACALSVSAFGQLREAGSPNSRNAEVAAKAVASPSLAPEPIQLNASYAPCKFMADSGDERFSHLTTAWEMFFNSGPAYPANVPLVEALPLRQLFYMDPNPDMFLTINNIGNNSLSAWNLSWTSPAAVDRFVAAVAVRGTASSAFNVYLYPDLSGADSGPFTAPSGAEITEVRFCFEPFSGPSSAPVAVGGRALTMNGSGVGNARIELMNLSTGETTFAMTNPFGYYTFKGVPSEATYMITASHKRHQFIDGQRTITINSDLTSLDFVSAW